MIAIVWYTFFTYALVANARDEAAHRQLEDQLIRTQLAYIARTLDVVSAEEIASAVVLGRSAEKMLNFLQAPTQTAGRARLFQWTRHFDALKAAAGAAKGTLAPAAVRAVEVVRAYYDSAEGVDNAVVSLEDLIGRVKRIAERSAEANLVLPQFGKSE